MAKAYLNYRLKAKKRHGVHSPFVYNLSEEVFYKSSTKKAEEIEAVRKELLRDQTLIELVDYGAGSRIYKGYERSISEIAKTSSSPTAMAQLMQRLISFLNLNNVLELGTNLGITTAYLTAANPNARVISLEGDPSLASIAVKNLQKIGLEAEIIEGRFEDTLDLALAKMPTVDFAYIDGNHRKQPTLNYFQTVLEKTTENSVLAFGDIHWSQEMEGAWNTIKQNKTVTLTIDLFDLGLVFFRKDRTEAEHFIIRL
ncbi:class I SAM-dependent methyltransferase [Cryomorphaceae bacterium 1068]|nr:class I SAM-dependent methyltransferase [Cryomorphaceae bacterium 1068]